MIRPNLSFILSEIQFESESLIQELTWQLNGSIESPCRELVAQKIETAFRLLKSTYMSHLSAMHRRASANRVKNVWNLLVDRSEVV